VSLELLPLQPDPSKDLPKTLPKVEGVPQSELKRLPDVSAEEEKDALEKEIELNEKRIEAKELQSGKPGIVYLKRGGYAILAGGVGYWLVRLAGCM
jgi:hypothetical protein